MLQDIGVGKVYMATDYKQGLQLFEEYAPDICLLDIDLGKKKKTGVQLAQAIRELSSCVSIIFLTSYYTDDYYKQVRSLGPSGFLNKELSKLTLHQAMDTALMQAPGDVFTKAGSTEPESTAQAVIEHLFFKVGDSYKRIPVDEVSYFFSKDKLNYALVGNRNYPTIAQLKLLEEELKENFIRTHKGFLVNLKFIDSINTVEGHVVIGEEILPVGHVYKKVLLGRLKLLK